MSNNETKQELMNMMELIDTIKDQIGDGKYLQLCNSLKKVSDKQGQSTDVDAEEEVELWGDDIDINAKYHCVIEFLEPRIIVNHNDSCTNRCRLHKPHIRSIHHGCSGVFLSGCEVLNVLFDLQNLGHHNTIDNRYTSRSIRLHLALELFLRARHEPMDDTKFKISFKSFTVLNIKYRRVHPDTDNEEEDEDDGEYDDQ